MKIHLIKGNLLKCCGKSPVQVSATDRVTSDPAKVTCRVDTN